jgi:hypothetical protein
MPWAEDPALAIAEEFAEYARGDVDSPFNQQLEADRAAKLREKDRAKSEKVALLRRLQPKKTRIERRIEEAAEKEAEKLRKQRQAMRRLRERDPERFAEVQRQYRQRRDADPERRAHDRAVRAARRKRWRQENPELAREQKRQWRARHKDRVNELQQARRARQKGQAQEVKTMAQNNGTELLTLFCRIFERLLTMSMEAPAAPVPSPAPEPTPAPTPAGAKGGSVVALAPAPKAKTGFQKGRTAVNKGKQRGDDKLGNRIITTVMETFGVSEKVFLSKGGPEEVQRARWVCWYLLEELAGFSKLKIASCFGCDDGRILKGIRDLAPLLDADKELAGRVSTIRKKVGRGEN